MGAVRRVDGVHFHHVSDAGGCFRRAERNDYKNRSERHFILFRRTDGRRRSCGHARIFNPQSGAHDGICDPVFALLPRLTRQRREACRADRLIDERGICGKRRIPSELHQRARSESHRRLHRHGRREHCAALTRGGFEGAKGALRKGTSGLRTKPQQGTKFPAPSATLSLRDI